MSMASRPVSSAKNQSVCGCGNFSPAFTHADGKDVSQSNTHVNAGNTLTIESGGDTNLKGATAAGKQVVADVGGNLNIESLQDTSTYKSKDQSLSGSVTVGYGFSASAAASQQKMDADFASVNEQSGIKAGDGGYKINVNGNTDLKGAVIASTDAATQNGLNSLSTDTLTTSEIKNHAEYHASSISLSGGYTSADYSTVKADGSRATPANTPTQGVGTDQQGNAATAGQTPGTRLPSTGANGTGASVAPPIVMAASDSDSSVTKSGISGGTLTIKNSDKQQELTGKTADDTVASVNRDVSTDKDTSSHIDNNFNKQEVQTAFDITAAFERETGTYLNNKAKDAQAAQDALKKEQDKPADQQNPALLTQLQQQVDDTAKWAPGGEYRQVMTAITAAAGGNVTGGSTQLIEGAAASYIQSLGTEQVKYIADSIGKGTPEAETARAALQALVACGGAAASGLNCGAAGTSAATSAVLNALLDKTTGDAQDLTPEQKEMRANLVESLISGIAATAGVNGDLGTVKGAAQIETENNALRKAVADKVTPALQLAYQTQGKKLSEGQAKAALNGLAEAAKQPNLTDEEKRAIKAAFFDIYTRGNADGVLPPDIGPTLVQMGIESMAFSGGGKTEVSPAGSATGPKLPGTTGSRTGYNTSGGEATAINYSGLKMDLKTKQAANDVIESLQTTGQLPSNYVTKAQAAQQGWQPGKALDNSVPGGQLGGDTFNNTPPITGLPANPSRTWVEVDIGLSGTQSRSNQPGTRLLYSNDGLLYVTTDHYKTVTPVGTWK